MASSSVPASTSTVLRKATTRSSNSSPLPHPPVLPTHPRHHLPGLTGYIIRPSLDTSKATLPVSRRTRRLMGISPHLAAVLGRDQLALSPEEVQAGRLATYLREEALVGQEAQVLPGRPTNRSGSEWEPRSSRSASVWPARRPPDATDAKGPHQPSSGWWALCV